ncbi:hypothetical protein FCM35_KLT17236 [Carex littledalei]|uniref:Phloem protein 2 n=1 Tax=Carex littledalei TaxID=544730 RepID=A0A833VZE6_9POAL|nr:hypothetical protein FCM35_KLT17236 [Carex littledalei]
MWKLWCCGAILPLVRGKKKSFQLNARAFSIIHSNNEKYWTWVRQSNSSFTEVAELLQVWWLEVHARINFENLSTETEYAVYLIFKTTPSSYGLDTIQEASVSVGSLSRKKFVCSKPSDETSLFTQIGLPVNRPDGWMELELGQFNCDHGTSDQEVVVGFKETNDNNEKSGLIIAGIELRPIQTV